MSLTDDEVRALGFDLPQGTDLISEGDNNIRRNARAAANLFASSYRVREQPPQGMTTLDSFNRESFNGIWQIGPQHGITDAPFPITTGTLFEVKIGSPANAGKQVVSDSSQSWWREAAGGGSGTVTSWGAWRKYADLDDIAASHTNIRGQIPTAETLDLNTFREGTDGGRWIVRAGQLVNGPDLSGRFLASGSQDILFLLDVKYGNNTTVIQELHARTAHFNGYFRRQSTGSSTFNDWEFYGVGPSKVREWHMFVAAGQSNMSGRGQPIGPEFDEPNYRILEYGSTSSATLRIAPVPLRMADTPSGLSPATVFAQEYLKTVPDDVGVLLLPCARGDSGFETDPNLAYVSWLVGMTGASQRNLYQRAVDQVNEAKQMMGDRGVLKGVLWHQGSYDASGGPAAYQENLDALIAGFRSEWGDPELPFMIGQLLPEGMDQNPALHEIDRVHYETPARITRTSYNKADRGWFSYDWIHLSRLGVIEQGKRYLDGYYRALANVDGESPHPVFNAQAVRNGDEIRVTWDAPYRRVTGYTVQYRVAGDSTWTTVERNSDMQQEAIFTASGSTEIRIRTENASGNSLWTNITSRLARGEYWSGERDITSLIVGRTGGRLLIERTGQTVQMTFDDLALEDLGTSYYLSPGLLPPGWRPGDSVGWRYLPLSPTSVPHSTGPIRVSRYGDLGVYDVDVRRILRGTVTWTTPDPVPTTPLGDPA